MVHRDDNEDVGVSMKASRCYLLRHDWPSDHGLLIGHDLRAIAPARQYAGNSLKGHGSSGTRQRPGNLLTTRASPGYGDEESGFGNVGISASSIRKQQQSGGEPDVYADSTWMGVPLGRGGYKRTSPPSSSDVETRGGFTPLPAIARFSVCASSARSGLAAPPVWPGWVSYPGIHVAGFKVVVLPSLVRMCPASSSVTTNPREIAPVHFGR